MQGRDPFRVLALGYDAGPDDVRAAFRRRARETHPDRGGSAAAFHHVRTAYGALTADLEQERLRWGTPEAPAPASRFAAGLDPRVYPTCPVRISRTRDGRRQLAFETGRRPAGWRPSGPPPPDGTCRTRVPASADAPAFGVWTVPAGPSTFRCVFGPAPRG